MTKQTKQTKQPVMEIPITEEELQELMYGKTFKWTFDGIDVKLFKEKE